MNNPKVWGPPMWLELHTRTFNYPECPTARQKLEEAHFFRTLDQKIPCKVCRGHYRDYLTKHPVQYHVDSQDELSRWLVNLHNEINVRTGKEIVSYDKAEDMYVKDNDTLRNWYIIITVILIAIIIVLLNTRP